MIITPLLKRELTDIRPYHQVTRVLAEEQFMKRALIEKIQSGIMPPAASSSDWPAPQGWR